MLKSRKNQEKIKKKKVTVNLHTNHTTSSSLTVTVLFSLFLSPSFSFFLLLPYSILFSLPFYLSIHPFAFSFFFFIVTKSPCPRNSNQIYVITFLPFLSFSSLHSLIFFTKFFISFPKNLSISLISDPLNLSIFILSFMHPVFSSFSFPSTSLDTKHSHCLSFPPSFFCFHSSFSLLIT